jgi:hypothetical protein
MLCRQGITSGDRDSVVSIAALYGLDGSGFEPRLGLRNFLFSIPVQPSPGAHPASTIATVGSFQLVNQRGCEI